MMTWLKPRMKGMIHFHFCAICTITFFQKKNLPEPQKTHHFRTDLKTGEDYGYFRRYTLN